MRALGTLRFTAVICLSSIPLAHADGARDLTDAIDTWNTSALQAQATQSSDAGQQDLARAVLEMFAGQDDTAIGSLEASIASHRLDDGLKFVAFKELGEINLRNQRYRQAAGSLESALALSGSAPTDDVEDVKDSLRYARAFESVPPMTFTAVARKASPVIRDAMDLPRVGATINGHHVDAVMDTAASNSLASASTAKRLHLRLVRFEGNVTGGAGSVAAQFAVADRLLFAGHEIRNVPFIVLPDEAVTVPLGDGATGRIEPIIGLSVLRRLGRLEIRRRDDRETLQVGGTSRTDQPTNLLLPRSLPLVTVRVGPDATELRLSLDTGSNRTVLAPAAISAHPALADGAPTGSVRAAAAGGVVSNDAATIIPQLTFRIGDVASTLSKVLVDAAPDHCDGTLGQDVLRSGGGYAIDFQRMTLEILAP